MYGSTRVVHLRLADVCIGVARGRALERREVEGSGGPTETKDSWGGEKRRGWEEGGEEVVLWNYRVSVSYPLVLNFLLLPPFPLSLSPFLLLSLWPASVHQENNTVRCRWRRWGAGILHVQTLWFTDSWCNMASFLNDLCSGNTKGMQHGFLPQWPLLKKHTGNTFWHREIKRGGWEREADGQDGGSL